MIQEGEEEAALSLYSLHQPKESKLDNDLLKAETGEENPEQTTEPEKSNE